jgi:hypothetical protein
VKLDNINRWLTLLANIGVIAGIIFLAIEIRQNTRSAQASSYEQLTGRVIDIVEGNVDRPELVTGEVSRDLFLELSEREQQQLRLRMIGRIRYGDLAFYQYELGMVGEERFESLIRPVTDIACVWVFQDVWSNMRPNFVTEYVEYIDEAVAKC